MLDVAQIEAKYSSKAAQLYKIALVKKVKASKLQFVALEVEEVQSNARALVSPMRPCYLLMVCFGATMNRRLERM